MTPAQKVALDAMREAWPTEVVERMLRAVDPEIEAAERVVVGNVREFLSWHDSNCPECFRRRDNHETGCAFDAALRRLSPPETPAATSTPHLPNETERVRAGDPVPNGWTQGPR